MLLLRHLCGQILERARGPSSTYYHLISLRNHAGRALQVQRCPRCHELLRDTDMLDSTGMPLIINLVSEQSRARRAILAGLATAGYTLRWEHGQWHIQDSDTVIAFADTLDAIVLLASAFTVQDSDVVVSTARTSINVTGLAVQGALDKPFDLERLLATVQRSCPSVPLYEQDSAAGVKAAR
jgi:hypothetical protein